MSNSKTIDSTITAKDVASHSAGDVQVLKLLENQRKDARVLKRVQTDAGRLSSVHDQKNSSTWSSIHHVKALEMLCSIASSLSYQRQKTSFLS